MEQVDLSIWILRKLSMAGGRRKGLLEISLNSMLARGSRRHRHSARQKQSIALARFQNGRKEE
jgi:hypothetical protein